jgi:hypothetical protein
MTKRVADVTDDQIVDAICAHGIAGWDSDDDDQMTDLLMAVDADEDSNDELISLQERLDTLTTIGARLREVGCSSFEVAPAEWARRVVGKSEAEIAAILQGNM